jgi:CubicO group peptidase (beta-lactamase class C family)
MNLDRKLRAFYSLAIDLEKQGKFDGELLIAHGDRILFEVRSDASLEQQEEPQFMIGSVSKQFFAVALLKALYDLSEDSSEERRVAVIKKKLHQPLSKYLPKECAVWNGSMPKWADKVTLHHLLSHTSGIPNYTDAEDCGYANLLDAKQHWFELQRTPKEIIKLIVKDPLLFSPGSEFFYSNTGYLLIAEVIESITHEKVSVYLQQAIFDPTGMNSTVCPEHGRWDELKRNSKISRLLPPLRYDPKEHRKTIYPELHCEDISTAKGTGSIISTAEDLLKWNLALHKKKSILPQKLYELMITENLDGYGYGIGIEGAGIGLAFGHSGTIGSYQTELYYLPEYDLSIVLLSNVCWDFDKISNEYDAIYNSLQGTISDETECDEAAQETLQKKYPFTRSYGILSKGIVTLFE